MRSVWFAFYFLIVVVTCAQTYPDQGGAQINQPFQRNVSGAVCFSGTGKLEGSAFFNFPTLDKQVVSFTIGPAAPGQEKNDRFTGAGTYPNIGIMVKEEDGAILSGSGEVVVNEDERTGAFTFKTAADNDDDDDEEKPSDAVASGIWDCGRKLKH
jgi:hypothetical protein